MAQGSVLGGWCLSVQDGRLRYVHNLAGCAEHRDRGAGRPRGRRAHARLPLHATAEHRGTGALLVDGAVVGEAEIPRFTPTRFSLTAAGLTCGATAGCR